MDSTRKKDQGSSSAFSLHLFLARYGKVLPGVRYLRDNDGIWTGKRQFRVLLNEDPQGFDGLEHSPAYFSIRAERGYLFSSGQPSFCRQCRSVGQAGPCGQAVCRNGGEKGHVAVASPKPRMRHSCGRATNSATALGRRRGGPTWMRRLVGRALLAKALRTCGPWRRCRGR
ncbi:zinc finger CCHC domain-containing protein 3-like isoform X2 [Anguilla anguilla]|uniref:zinc finger CCHC domain-containing protein 3-like isoform X2 n=1 Tax=Anguilla anguilla TaxID=7936 RepID=UPI0015B36E1A|nr:zinc finger CCHC domain-containing protein 3-like isoform X2 [Anguilla anguilla]